MRGEKPSNAEHANFSLKKDKKLNPTEGHGAFEGMMGDEWDPENEQVEKTDEQKQKEKYDALLTLAERYVSLVDTGKIKVGRNDDNSPKVLSLKSDGDAFGVDVFRGYGNGMDDETENERKAILDAHSEIMKAQNKDLQSRPMNQHVNREITHTDMLEMINEIVKAKKHGSEYRQFANDLSKVANESDEAKSAIHELLEGQDPDALLAEMKKRGFEAPKAVRAVTEKKNRAKTAVLFREMSKKLK